MAKSRPPSSSERSPREAAKGLSTSEETRAAARDATLRFVSAATRVGVQLTGGLARGLRASARWMWPRLRRAAIVTGGGLARASVRAARWCWTQRVALTRVGHRLLWWTALVLLVLAGRALLGEGTGPGDELWLGSMLQWFVIGLAMAGVVLLTAPEPRMRRAAFALAGSHGALALLVQFAGS